MSIGSSHAVTTAQAITWVGWQRLCAIGGMLFSLLGIAAIAILRNAAPGLEATSSEIAATYKAQHTGVLVADFLLALGTFFFLWFLGGLRSALRQQEEEPGTLSSIAYGAGLLAAAAILADAALESGFAFRAAGMPHIASTEESLVLAFSNTLNVLFSFIWLAAAGVVSSVSVANLWAGFQPRWLAQAGLGLSVIMLLNPVVMLTDGTGFWFLITATACAGFLIWTFVTSVYLFLRANLRAARG